MSTDTDRLATVLLDLSILQQGLVEVREVLSDVVTAVAPVELETDPEGHVALKRITDEISNAHKAVMAAVHEVDVIVATLASKARL